MLLISVLAVLGLNGCDLKYHSAPGAPLPFASVDYTVLGETSAEACGNYILGIDFGHILRDKGGSTGGGGGDSITALVSGFLPSGPPEVDRATYEALEKMPEATNLYSPRSHTTVVGFAPFGVPFFAKRCSSVVAHGVKLGTGPVPNAN